MSVGRIYYQIFITFKWDVLELTWYSANSIAIVFKVLSAGWSNLWASWNPVGKNVQFKTRPLKSSLEQINTIISLQIIVVLHIMNKQKETRWKTKWKVHILIKKVKGTYNEPTNRMYLRTHGTRNRRLVDYFFLWALWRQE